MGRVEFRLGSFRIPFQAKTGEEVSCEIVVTNTDDIPLTWVRSKVVWEIATDSEGRNIIDRGSIELDVWTYADAHIYATFIMPPYDIFVGVKLYQLVDDQWILVDSTVFIPIDNPEYPTLWMFWEKELFGLKIYQWMLIGMAIMVGVLIVKK